MATINIKDRHVRGSAKKALIDMHTDVKWAIFEALLNSMTAMRNMDKKEVYITQNAGNKHDIIIEDFGEGFSNEVYEYLENDMGYEPDEEEYINNQKDPEFLNKMGIGINGIADMSIDGILEFYSVSIDKHGRENGLIVRYMIDRKKGVSGFVVPAEHPSHTYVLQRKPDQIQTGVKLVIKNAKQVKNLSQFIAEKFARKITQGYRIFIRNREYDVFEHIHPPKDFCSKHEEVIGSIERYPVYADLHSVDKKDDVKVDVLVKKIRLGAYESKYLMKGYAGCDILEIVANREGIKADESNEIYQAFSKIVDNYAQLREFDLIPQTEIKVIKNEKRWIEKVQEMFMKYYRQNPTDTLLQINAIKQSSELTGEPIKPLKIKRPHKREHNCQPGYHWNAELQECIPKEERTEPIIPRGPQKPRTGLKPKLSDQYDDESIPRIKIGWRPFGNDKWCMVFDEQASMIWFNTSHEWTNNKLLNASDETKELVSMIAIMIAVPNNHDMSIESFHKKLSGTLDGN